MKNVMRQTSIDSWMALTDLVGRQKAVYDTLLKYGPLCNLQLAHELSAPINSVTPRTNELVAKGMVEEDHRGPSPFTGRTAIFWRVVDKHNQ